MKRLDVLMAERNLVESREQARRLIMAGAVLVGGMVAAKPSQEAAEDAVIELIRESPYVSRGGFKLEKALAEFALNLEGLTCADIGASTGGFTDCMLQRGAAQVYAVDVGYGQLHYKLRNDERVVVMERTNARYLTPETFAAPPSFASIDVAFISLKLILPALFPCLAPGAPIVALVKPQFETEPKHVRKGVVRDEAIHRQVLDRILHWLADQPVAVRGLSFSPITGPKGNIEFLLYLSNGVGPSLPVDTAAVVAAAHESVRHNPLSEA